MPTSRPFCRHDYQRWSYVLSIFTHFFFIPRWIIGWCVFTSAAGLTKILTYGHVDGTPFNPRVQAFLRWYYRWVAWGVGLTVGYVWTGLIRTEADYRKWLGPDWKATYEGAGIQIMNHTSPFDTVMMQAILPWTSVLGKEEARKIPGCAGVIDVSDHVLVSR